MEKKVKANSLNMRDINGLIEGVGAGKIDINYLFASFLKAAIEKILKIEMDEHLGNKKSERTKEGNYRNGTSKKTVRTKGGEIELDIPRDRAGKFEPKLIKKHERELDKLGEVIIDLYAKGMSTRDISDAMREIYGFTMSESYISRVTNEVEEEVEEWKNRPLKELYINVQIDCTFYSVKTNEEGGKQALYMITGINNEGIQEILGMYTSTRESSRFWISIFDDLKRRGVKDIIVISSDGLRGIKEAIVAAFPKADHQLCIVHETRNTLKQVSYKERKELAGDLKKIYHAISEEIGLEMVLETKEKWYKKYPRIMLRWERDWNELSNMYKYPAEMRKIIYTTNPIESINSTLRRKMKNKKAFNNERSLIKSAYLSLRDRITKWNKPIENIGICLAELEVIYPGRIPI